MNYVYKKASKLLLLLSAFFLLASCFAEGELATTQSEPMDIINQKQLDDIANSLQIHYQVVSNIPSKHCKKKQAAGHCFEARLILTATHAITVKNWAIYFSFIYPIQSSSSNELNIRKINGDLHKLSLSQNFKGFAKGETKSITLWANFWSVSETDALPNYIISAPTLIARVIKSTKTVIDPQTGLEQLPFVVPFNSVKNQFKRTKNDKTQWLTSELLYKRNSKMEAKLIDVSKAIIPTPSVIKQGKGSINISHGITVTAVNVPLSSITAALQHLHNIGIAQTIHGVKTTLEIKPNLSKVVGSYTLSITKSGINIVGSDDVGVFYGLQSMASLVMLGSKQLPEVSIIDEPRYPFRGMLIDVARNFHSKAFLISLMDQMAAYKLNELHLHLADDEGWRLAIPGLPELTKIGSQRCFDLSEHRCLLPQLGAGTGDAHNPVNGYYSVQDFKEILMAAKARHIQVIPSMDMPGHSRAAIKSMDERYRQYQLQGKGAKARQYLLSDFEDKTQYSSVQHYNDNTLNVCQKSTYDFVDKVITETQKIYQSVGLSLTRYHIGADETAGAWLDSPQCKIFLIQNKQGITKPSELAGYFVERIANMLAKKGIEAAAWSDGLMLTRTVKMPAVIQANAWGLLPWGGFKTAHELVNRNWQVVLSTPDVLYFDFPYEADPKENGYYWGSRQINTAKIFQFMPDNLPIQAEYWFDREQNPFESDDRAVGYLKHKGKKYWGMQGQLWSEITRTDATAQYKIFPRLLALAERAWHKPNWAVAYNEQGARYDQNTAIFSQHLRDQRDKNWRWFANVVGQKELPKLDLAGVKYRLPTVGAVVRNGILKANIAFPGLAIMYKTGNSAWQRYRHPTKVFGDVWVRSRVNSGNRVGRTLKVRFH